MNERARARIKKLKDQGVGVIAGPRCVHRGNKHFGWLATFGKGVSYRPDPHGQPDEYLPTTEEMQDLGNSFQRTNSDGRARVPKVGNAAFQMHQRQAGAPLVWRYVGANPVQVEEVSREERPKGPHYKYTGLYEDVDLVVQVGPYVMKADIILTGPNHPAHIEIQLPGNPQLLEEHEEYLVYQHGNRKAKVYTPFAWVEVGVTKEPCIREVLPGNVVRYTFPPVSSYPTVFDPVVALEPDADAETNTCDGYTERSAPSGTTWSIIRDGTPGTAANDSSAGAYGYLGEYGASLWSLMRRGVMMFDTSSLDAGADLQWATLRYGWASNYYGLDTAGHISFTTVTTGSNTSLSTSDFNTSNYGSTDLMKSDWNSALANTTLGCRAILEPTTLTTAINRGGITKLAFRTVDDVTNTEPSHSAGSENCGQGFDTADSAWPPELTVMYDCTFTILDYGYRHTGSGNTVVTNSITPTANAQVYFAIGIDGSWTATPDATTASGCGITWSNRYEWQNAPEDEVFVLFNGSNASPSTGAITATFDSGDTWGRYIYLVVELATGHSEVQTKTAGSDNQTSPWSVSLDSTMDTGNYGLAFVTDLYNSGARGNWDMYTGDLGATSNWDMGFFASTGGLDGIDGPSNTGPAMHLWFVSGSAETTFNFGQTAAGDFGAFIAELQQAITKKILSESLNMTESAVDVPSALKILSETLNLGESNSYLLGVARVISETLNLTESNATLVTFVKVISESLNMAQSVYSALIPFPVKVFRATGMGIRGFKDGYNLLVRSFRGKRQQTRGFK